MQIAIDFTGSNGDPNLKESLHSIIGENQYYKAIKTVSNVLEPYDSYKRIWVYGFGGILNPNSNT